MGVSVSVSVRRVFGLDKRLNFCYMGAGDEGESEGHFKANLFGIALFDTNRSKSEA